MTVSSTISKVSYAGNGVTTDFSTGFAFLDDSHVLVTLVDSDGVETTETITTHYTLVGAGTGVAGTVTMLIEPATGETLVISRDIDATQETDYVENGPFPAQSHENALDKLTMIAQQILERLGRALTFPISSTVSGEMSTPTPLGFLRFNADGDELETVTLTESGVGPSDVTFDNLNANGDIGFGAGQVPEGDEVMPLTQIGVTAGDVVQVDQAITATTRATTTTLGTTLNHTLSDTSATITAFNGEAGVTYHCRALGAGSITHHATNLIITQTSADITTAAGDTFDVYMVTASTARITNYQCASGNTVRNGGKVAQVVYTQTGASTSTAAPIPFDDSPPQSNEGLLALTRTITPTNALSTLVIEVLLYVNRSGEAIITGSLFKDGNASASAAGAVYPAATGSTSPLSIKHSMVAATTSEITFTVRYGPNVASVITLNGVNQVRRFGGVLISSITITEVLP